MSHRELSRRSGLGSWLGVVWIGISVVAAACAQDPQEISNGAPDPDQILHRLVRATGEQRPVEPRITGGFRHGPCGVETPTGHLVPVARCAPEPSSGEDRFDSLAHIAPALSGRVRGRSPAVLRNQAVWHLIWNGRSESADRAITELSEARTGAPGDPLLESDLGAAYLQRAQTEDRPADLLRALDHTRRALELRPDLLEAEFNAALLYGRLGLRGLAESAWMSYLEKETDPGWSGEAAERLEHLRGQGEPTSTEAIRSRFEATLAERDADALQALVSRFGQQAIDLGQDQLLGDWAEAWSAGSKEAAATILVRLELLADAIEHQLGDALLADTVSAIVTAEQRADEPRLRNLALGIRAYTRAKRLRDERRIRPARSAALESYEILERSGSPMAAKAAREVTALEFLDSGPQEGKDLFDHLPDPESLHRYPVLQGRVLWMRALLHQVAGEPAKALADYAVARDLLTAAGQEEDATTLTERLGPVNALLGRPEEAAREGYRALLGYGAEAPPERLFTALNDLGETAISLGARRAALAVREELVHHARTDLGPEGLTQALYWRARDEAALGMREEAARDLTEAGENLSAVSDPSLRNRIAALLDLARGEVLLDSDAGAALSYLDSAARYFSGPRFASFRVVTGALAARAHLLLGEIEAADQRFAAVLGEVERERRTIGSGSLRRSFLDQSKRFYEERLLLLTNGHGTDLESLSVAEASRARSLLEARSGGGREEPSSIGRGLQRLPAGVDLVEYEVTPERLLVWTVVAGEVQTSTIEISAGELGRGIEALRAALAARDGEAVEARAGSLYDLLWRPIEARLQPGDLAVISPDEVLYALPFAALRNPATGRFLVEDRAIALTPSAAVLLAGRAPRHRSPSVNAEPTALVVGNPAPGGDDRRLAPLPGAESEARRVAALYPSELLLGAEATPRRIRDALPTVTVFHFAGHSEPSADGWEQGRLFLAPGEGDGAAFLTGREIGEMQLSACRLVVLGACRTGIGPISSSEGPASLVHPFLKAGVPAVVAALWDVDDAASAELLVRFHEEYRRSGDATEALRAAQLGLLRNPGSSFSSPSAWAGFEVFEGEGGLNL